MRRTKYSILLTALLMVTTPTTLYAADTAAARPSPTAKPVKKILTQTQKEAIAAARLAFAVARTNAQNGFDRALADAKAVRDQSILAAGQDKGALAAAKKSYEDSYKVILNAYKTYMRNAKAVFRSALSAAYSMHSTN